MTRTRLHVNRTRELRHIRTVLEERRPTGHLVAIEALGNMGKTALMIELMTNPSIHARKVRVDLSHDFDTKCPDPTEVLGDLVMGLRHSEVDLPRYAAGRNRVDNQSIVVTDVRMRGSTMPISQHRDARIRNDILLDELTADLVASSDRSTLVLVDTFDQAEEPCRRWLVRRLVPMLLTVPRLVVVVAGRDVSPLSTGHRLPETFRLNLFQPDHVVDWLVARSATYTPHDLRLSARVICEAGKGIPATIAGIIGSLESEKWPTS